MREETRRDLIERLKSEACLMMNELEYAQHKNLPLPKDYDPLAVVFLRVNGAKKQISKDFVEDLAKLKEVEHLYVSGCAITDQDLARLSALTNLVSLSLKGTNISNASLPYLSQLPKLTHLWVDKLLLNGKNLACIASIESLQTLSIGSGTSYPVASIYDEDMACFFAHKNLSTLSVEGTLLSKDSFALFDSLPKLSYLDVTNTSITEEQILAYKQTKPRLIVHYIDY